MSDTVVKKSRHVVRYAVLTVCAAILFGIGIFVSAHLLGGRHPKESARRVGHAANLRLLGVNLRLYADEHGGAYPPPEKWCDVLLEWSAGHLREALRYPRGEREGCPYAMNPHAAGCGKPDVVLLFESRPGWNQAGGLELLTVEDHEDEGYNVLFINGTVRFIQADEVVGLNWADANEPPEDVRNARRPANDKELRDWLENMIWHHRFTTEEVRLATGSSQGDILAAQKKFNVWPGNRSERDADGPLLVLPYPGGRHPRIGFLEGAIDPQRETKFSVFAPWDPNGYVVVDVPEAIWSDLGLTYLAHTHIDTIWTKQGIELPKLEWNRRPDGSLDIERTLPNGLAFGVKAVPDQEAVHMEMWLHDGTDEKLSDLRVQICVMTKMAAGFAQQTNENKVFTNPYVACRSQDGKRWIITAWESCDRPWGNEQCPCFHSDPKFPDLEAGQKHVLHGWLSFYEGDDVQAEFRRIEATGWREN